MCSGLGKARVAASPPQQIAQAKGRYGGDNAEFGGHGADAKS